MEYNKRAIGKSYERMAGAYLTQQGYEIITYNYRCKRGEIDIVAMEGEYLVFCEVKYRADLRKGYPLEAVDIKKQKVISRCADCYLLAHGLSEVPVRFDVVGILGDEIELIRNAFWYAG